MRLIYYIFILFCFFPYIDIIGLGTDTQPNALIAALIILFAIPNKKLNTPMLLLWLLFLFSLVLAVFSNLSGFDTLKNILNYLSPALLCLAVYNLFLMTQFRVSFRFFLSVLLIYFSVGFIQLYIDPDFLMGIVNEGGRGSLLAGRGVVSLCPEPAFYGSMCLFFMVFGLLNYTRRQNLIIAPIVLVQLILFSQSATAIFIFLAAVTGFVFVQIIKLRPLYIIGSLVLAFAAKTVIHSLRQGADNYRAAGLVYEFINDPLLIAQLDISAGVRISSSLAPFLSAKHHGMLPMGMGNYKAFVKELYLTGDYGNMLNSYILNEIGRLGGGINMVLFHLGFLGLIFPLAIYMMFKAQIGQEKAMFAMILLFCLLFTQIQLMHAMIGLILGLAAFKSRELPYA